MKKLLIVVCVVSILSCSNGVLLSKRQSKIIIDNNYVAGLCCKAYETLEYGAFLEIENITDDTIQSIKYTIQSVQYEKYIYLNPKIKYLLIIAHKYKNIEIHVTIDSIKIYDPWL